jgi:hypothetical protein
VQQSIHNGKDDISSIIGFTGSSDSLHNDIFHSVIDHKIVYHTQSCNHRIAGLVMSKMNYISTYDWISGEEAGQCLDNAYYVHVQRAFA